MLISLHWALIASVLAALLRARDRPLKLYLLTFLIGTVIAEAVLWAVHGNVDSLTYTIAYVLTSSADVAMMFYLARPKLFAFTIMLTVAAAVWMQMPHLPNSIITWVEGAALLLAGFSMAGGLSIDEARNLRHYTQHQRFIYGTLAVLWTMLGLYDAGYALGWQLPAWHSLNEWWTYAICIGAFSLIAACGSLMNGTDQTCVERSG